MSKAVFSNLVSSMAVCALVVGCAKAGYYEKTDGALGTLSADNDLVLTEGQRRDFTIKLTTDSENNESFRWVIRSNQYIPGARFKTPTGMSNIAKGQRDLIVSISAADVDQIQQGTQIFELELEATDGKKNTVPLTLLDVPVNTRPSKSGPVRPSTSHGRERTIDLTVKDAGTQPLVKVLLVMDNSYSMKKKQTQLADGIRSIAKTLAGKNLQFFLYTTSNDHDDDGRFDKLTTETVNGKKSLHAPFQDKALIIREDMPAAEFDRTVADLQRNILNLGHIGSKNESALCTLNNILREQDVKKQVLKKGDDALVFILSDTDDHAKDVPVKDCGGTVSSRKIVSALDSLLGRNHYGITAVISNPEANKGHTCGSLILDEGVQYTSLVKSSPTPTKIFSICAKDYSEALDSVNVFSRGSIVNVFKLELKDNEKVARVQLIRGGREVTLSEDNYEVRGSTLRISQKSLRLGDRLRVVLNQK
jgi:hypothetical protein